MNSLTAILGEIELSGLQGVNSPRPTTSHTSPAFVCLAVVALGLIGFLVWDFCHQKHLERRERRRLERFREQRLKQFPTVPVLEKAKSTLRAER